jgi:hypothetical protein
MIIILSTFILYIIEAKIQVKKFYLNFFVGIPTFSQVFRAVFRQALEGAGQAFFWYTSIF